MSIGQAYTEACDLLIDSVFDDLENVKDPQDVINTMVGIYLPDRYLHKYTPLFLKKFAVCIITVAWKLAQPKHMPLSSVAEELAARAIIKEAQGLVEERAKKKKAKNAFGAFIDEYFEDTDFEFLFEDAYDGIDETEVGQMMGMASLAFDDWFTPFSDDPSRIAHPYVLDEEISKQASLRTRRGKSPVSNRSQKIMTETEFDALCEWLGGPEGCNFRQKIPGNVESTTWTCDHTLKLTRQWMRAHGVDEAANVPELEKRGGYCDCEVLFNVTQAPRDWFRSSD
jgi:Protein of unknown function (DUF2695)